MVTTISPLEKVAFQPTNNGFSLLGRNPSAIEKNYQRAAKPGTPSILSAIRPMLVEPRTPEQTGISEDFLHSLALKMLYKNGVMEGGQIAVEMRLNFSRVVEPVLVKLKKEAQVTVRDGNHLNPASYRYELTEKGTRYARQAQERNRYVGPCPVSLDHYFQLVKAQAARRPLFDETEMRRAFQDLILSSETLERIGPAVISFKSLFLYGPPGNGKTSIAKAIGQHLLGGEVMVPYAIFADGQVIKVYDPETHQPLAEGAEAGLNVPRLDKRWIRCRPPVVTVGGELTLEDLNLVYNDTARYYEAPLQLKANGGMFLIDDFGRQQMQPQDLLNRWIVPLEERLDYLTFHNGKKVAIPFETLIIFSTNLEPEDLVDGAFLRRIRYKLEINYPDLKQFYQIFVRVCQERNLPFNRQAFTYLIENYYRNQQPERPFQACHPRDLLDQLSDFALFQGESARLTEDLIGKAASSYFTRLS